MLVFLTGSHYVPTQDPEEPNVFNSPFLLDVLRING
jgi:hypothetical protein